MIHNNYKSKGFGKLIYESLENTHIRTDVVTNYDENALHFWIKNGFKKLENITLNWTGKSLPAVIMKKEL